MYYYSYYQSMGERLKPTPQSKGKHIGSQIYQYAVRGIVISVITAGGCVAFRTLESSSTPPSGISDGGLNNSFGGPQDFDELEEGCSMFIESTPYDQATRTANLVRGGGDEPRNEIIQVTYPNGQELRGPYDEIYALTDGQVPAGTRVCVLNQ